MAKPLLAPKIEEGNFRAAIAKAIKQDRHVEYLKEVLREYEWYRNEFSKIFSSDQPARAIYRFRIDYLLKRGVSRDIEILGMQTFEKLARLIVKSMGWYYDHMHGFTVSDIERPASKKMEWPMTTRLEFFEQHWEDDPFPTYKSNQIKIYQIDYKRFPVLNFIFDFGDGHEFKIRYLGATEKRGVALVGDFPRVVKKRGVAPEQY